MDFHTYTTSRDTRKKAGLADDADAFYRAALAHAARNPTGGFSGESIAEQAWEQAGRPYYAV